MLIGVVGRCFLGVRGLLNIIGDGRGEDHIQTDLLNNFGCNGVAEELVEVEPGEAGLLFGSGNVTLVLTQLDFVALLGISEVCDRGLVLNFLLDDLLLQVGGIEFDEHFIGFDILFRDEVALIDDS